MLSVFLISLVCALIIIYLNDPFKEGNFDFLIFNLLSWAATCLSFRGPLSYQTSNYVLQAGMSLVALTETMSVNSVEAFC